MRSFFIVVVNQNVSVYVIVKNVAKSEMKTVNAIHLNVKTSLKFQNKFFYFSIKFHLT
jgi:hypothetical protein